MRVSLRWGPSLSFFCFPWNSFSTLPLSWIFHQTHAAEEPVTTLQGSLRPTQSSRRGRKPENPKQTRNKPQAPGTEAQAFVCFPCHVSTCARLFPAPCLLCSPGTGSSALGLSLRKQMSSMTPTRFLPHSLHSSRSDDLPPSPPSPPPRNDVGALGNIKIDLLGERLSYLVFNRAKVTLNLLIFFRLHRTNYR